MPRCLPSLLTSPLTSLCGWFDSMRDASHKSILGITSQEATCHTATSVDLLVLTLLAHAILSYPPGTNHSMRAIEFRHVSKSYQQGSVTVRALDDVSLTIDAGRFVTVMGASGSGKSTLLHLVAGLTRPTSGEIIVFDQALQTLDDDHLTDLRRTRIGLIFQAFNLLPTLTALENVALPLLIDGARPGPARQAAAQILDTVGLSDRATHRPDELSGGQQQRVAIARALINHAPLLLADEPTGNLDSQTGEDILRLLRRLVDDQPRTIIMVTHDARAAAYADQIIRLRDGRLSEG
jgi:putative ABC transport system ATP-binding protein